MSAVVKIVGKDGSIREMPRAQFVAKTREKVEALIGEKPCRPLRVICDVCGQTLIVPMKTLSRASCLALLRSIDFKIGGKERVEILREIVDECIGNGRLKDFKSAKAVPKRCEEHWWCPGFGDEPCPVNKRASANSYTPSSIRLRGGGWKHWRCMRCTGKVRIACMSREERARRSLRCANAAKIKTAARALASRKNAEAAKMGKRKPVKNLDTGEVFRSLKEAASAAGSNSSSLSEAIQRGRKCRGYRWCFEAAQT